MRESVRELFESLRTLDRAVWVLVCGSFINRFGSFVFVFLALYLTSEGYAPSEAGVAIALYGIGALFSTWLGGHLADRFPRRTTIAISMGGSAIFVVSLAFAHSWTPILILSALVGAAAELYRPASSALIIDLVPERERVTAFALNRLAMNLGMALGPMVGGFVAERSFFLLFILDGVTSLLFGIVALRWLPTITLRGPESSLHVPSRVFQDRVFTIFLAGTFCIAIVIFQIGSTLPLHVVSSGYTAMSYGFLVSINGWIVVTLELLLTTWTRRLDARWPIAIGYLLLGSGMFLAGSSSTFPWMVAGMVLFTLGEITAVPVSAAYVARLAAASLRGRYMGAWTMVWSLGVVAGPMGGMWLLEHHATWLWRGCLLAGIAGGALAALSISRAGTGRGESPSLP